MKITTGHTLLELIYGMAIFAVLTTIAAPAFSTLQKRSSNFDTTNQLLSALHYARSTSAHGGAVITLCPGVEQCSSEPIWRSTILAFVDVNRNGVVDGEESPLHSFAVRDGYFWHWNNLRRTPYVQYQPNGTTLGQNGTFTLCSDDLQSSSQILINVIGRARVREQQMDSVCATAALRR